MNPKKPRAKRIKYPKHAVIGRAYRFPLETTKVMSDKLFAIKDLCWEVRNLLVAERAANRQANRLLRDAGEPVSYLTKKEQYVRVALVAKADRRFQIVHSQVLQDVACRVDEGTQRWLDALKTGKKRVAPPGPIDKKDYQSFTFTQYGFAARLKRGLLHLSKIGTLPVRDYRKMRGQPKTVTIKFEEGRWWAIIICAIQPANIFRSAAEVAHLPDIGADPGLTSLLTMADGTVFDPPRALKRRLQDLRHAQRDMSRKFAMRKKLNAQVQAQRQVANLVPLPPLREMAYSRRLSLQIKKVAKIHTEVKHLRQHHHRKIARTIERTYRLVAVEEHGLLFMLKNRRLAKSAADRGIAAQKAALKAVLGPRYVPTANQRAGIGGNSQTCLCGAAVPKTLTVRVHDCPECGLVAPRDVVSANICMLIAFGSALLKPTTLVATKANTETNAEAGNTAPDATQNNATQAAGLAVAGRKTTMHGDVERTKTGCLAVAFRVAGHTAAAETSVKRKPVLPKGSEARGGEPALVANTSRVLLEQNSAALLACGEHTNPRR